MKKLALILIMIAVASSAAALVSKGTDPNTYVFTMLVNDDGSVIDNGTITLNSRMTKTEMQTFLKSYTVGTAISFGYQSVYRLSVVPGKSNSDTDYVVHIFFGTDGLSRYAYIMPAKISPAE